MWFSQRVWNRGDAPVSTYTCLRKTSFKTSIDSRDSIEMTSSLSSTVEDVRKDQREFETVSRRWKNAQ